MTSDDGVEIIRARMLKGVPHGFVGRRGGRSTGVFAGLNAGFGSGDDLRVVRQNRRMVRDAVLPGATLIGLSQVHSADVVTLFEPVDDSVRPHADALVTNRPGLLLGIVTADCAPVLLADTEAGVIGAAHAGWRGAIAGITDSAVTAMEMLGARRDRIVAAVGPCIARASYEVDATFVARFVGADPANERFFHEHRPDRARFDLEGYVVHRLGAAGLRQVEALGIDTFADADRFYSCRRALHRNEPSFGRQLSVIGLPG